jgi:hypothetical protein
MRCDYRRATGESGGVDLGEEYRALLAEYDRGGLPFERALTRLSYAAWLLARGEVAEVLAVNAVTLALARQHGMRVLEFNAWAVEEEVALRRGEDGRARSADQEAERVRRQVGLLLPRRP